MDAKVTDRSETATTGLTTEHMNNVHKNSAGAGPTVQGIAEARPGHPHVFLEIRFNMVLSSFKYWVLESSRILPHCGWLNPWKWRITVFPNIASTAGPSTNMDTT